MKTYMSHDCALHQLGVDEFIFVKQVGAIHGRPADVYYADAGFLELVRHALTEQGRLFTLPTGGFALVSPGRRPVCYASLSAVMVALELWFRAATTRAPVQPHYNLPTNAGELNPIERWRAVCAANEWHPVRVAYAPTGLLDYLSSNGTPQFFGALRHPIVGDARDWFPPPAPPEADPSYPHLRALFSGVPVSPAGHARLHAYLLHAFHHHSLTSASPLLVVDSGAQSQGKSQITNAIQQILDGEPGRIGYAPVNAGDASNSHDTFVAHFMAGGRVLNLDNLESVRRWNAPWIASLLTSRAAAARPKYARATEAFRGKLVTLNFVLGEAWLHPDLVSRAWRVPIRASAPVYFHGTPVPEEFAVAHTAELRAECYWAVARTAGQRTQLKGADRMVQAWTVGVDAYAHVFGLDVAEVLARLGAAEHDKRGLTAEFLVVASRSGLYSGSPPHASGPVNLAGAEGFGHRVAASGTLEKIDDAF